MNTPDPLASQPSPPRSQNVAQARPYDAKLPPRFGEWVRVSGSVEEVSGSVEEVEEVRPVLLQEAVEQPSRPKRWHYLALVLVLLLLGALIVVGRAKSRVLPAPVPGLRRAKPNSVSSNPVKLKGDAISLAPQATPPKADTSEPRSVTAAGAVQLRALTKASGSFKAPGLW